MYDSKLWQDKLAEYFHDPFVKAFIQGKTGKKLVKLFGEELPEIPDDHDEEEKESDNKKSDYWGKFAQDKMSYVFSNNLLGSEFVSPRPRITEDVKTFSELTESNYIGVSPEADWAAAGADRPVLGSHHQIRVQLWEEGKDHITITHPLAKAPLKIPTPDNIDDLFEKIKIINDLLAGYHNNIERNKEKYKTAFLYAWRNLYEELAEKDGVFWPLQPADTRCPDHSIWDHLKVASSLSFIPKSVAADKNLRERNKGLRPWFLTVWIGPTKDYVEISRTGRDLWTGSMMLSELAWSMIEVVAENLGPDAVVYPDLRGNLRADCWLERKGIVSDKTPKQIRSSLIPNRFVAVIPEKELDSLIEKIEKAVNKKWKNMADSVKEFLRKKTNGNNWEKIFDEQVKTPPKIKWAAVEWKWDGKVKNVKKKDVKLPSILPFLTERQDYQPEKIRKIEEKRNFRFKKLIDSELFAHYQGARQTFMVTHPGYLYNQRGFDYALYHSLLLNVLGAEKRLGYEYVESKEPGEKCTLCGRRQVLTNKTSGTVAEQRRNARKFWKTINPGGEVSERLCGWCSIKRFYSEVGNFYNNNNNKSNKKRSFASTGLIAGQKWVETVCENYLAGKLSREIDDVIRAVKEYQKDADNADNIDYFTQHFESLPRFQKYQNTSAFGLKDFLSLDIQYLEPEFWEKSLKANKHVSQINEIKFSLQNLHGKLKKLQIKSPQTHVALITLDGDQMGDLIAGNPGRIKARWMDVLHPETVRQIQTNKKSDIPEWKKQWRLTLFSQRLTGPSVHAFISRALRYFSNRVIPWVVEREYGGHLIYAGGDDALVLCPAEDALPMLQRLNELFTAPWILDTNPEASTWSAYSEAEKDLYEVGGERAKSRFKVINDDMVPKVRGRIFPMLGPNSSFSAGVAFGHYKTTMRSMKREAAKLIKDAKILTKNVAKEKITEGHVKMTWFTRSGPKNTLKSSLNALENIMQITDEFYNNDIPARLPYKLMELEPFIKVIIETERNKENKEDKRKEIVNKVSKIISKALDKKINDTEHNDIYGDDIHSRIEHILSKISDNVEHDKSGPIEKRIAEILVDKYECYNPYGLQSILFMKTLASHLSDSFENLK